MGPDLCVCVCQYVSHDRRAYERHPRVPRPADAPLLLKSLMRPMRGADPLPHVDGGGSDAGPPPSVFP